MAIELLPRHSSYSSVPGLVEPFPLVLFVLREVADDAKWWSRFLLHFVLNLLLSSMLVNWPLLEPSMTNLWSRGPSQYLSVLELAN